MEVRKSRSLLLMVLVLTWGLAAGWALAAPPDNFTAKMVTMGMSMPMAKMGNKTRLENVAGMGMVTISFRDAKKSVTFNPKQKVYFEQVLDEKMPSIQDSDVVIDKKKIGSETIDGHPCIKYDAVFYHKDRPQEKYKAMLWEAQDLGGLAIRNEMMIPEGKAVGKPGGKMVSEIKEIKVGGASASMFEVPAGYKKVNSMAEVMGLGQGNTQEMMKQFQRMQKKGAQPE
jgi:Domain of unknown function (DUF4412)